MRPLVDRMRPLVDRMRPLVYRCPNIPKESNEKIQSDIREVSKGDCIEMGDFNNGNIQWDTLVSTGVEDQQ